MWVLQVYLSFMNVEEIRKKISQIENQQREAQAKLEKLRRRLPEPKPKTPERKKKMDIIYAGLFKTQADFKGL